MDEEQKAKTLRVWNGPAKLGIHHNGSHKNRKTYNNFKSVIDFKKAGFVVPDNLLLITCHNRKDSFFEEQMRDYGCNDYKVLNIDLLPWSNTLRLRPYVEYLENEAKDKEYVIFVDSDDAFIQRSPEYILNRFLTEYDCDLLYNATLWVKGYVTANWSACDQAVKEGRAKAGTPICQGSIDARDWAKKNHPGKFLNAGAYIGRKDFIIEVYKDVLNYVTDNDPPHQTWYTNHKKFREGFPKGCGSDQVILRHLEPKYYPRLQIDKSMKFLARR